SRLLKADPVLGVDMASTGEVGCIGDDTSEAVMKSMLSVGYSVPAKGILLSTGDGKQKAELLHSCELLSKKGYKLYSTGGTYRYLKDNNIQTTQVFWPSEKDKTPQAIDLIQQKKIDMVVNIPKNLSKTELDNGYKVRRAAVDFNIQLLTNTRLASAFINAFCTISPDQVQIKSWDEY
ncbi:MAG: carbamoyl phosphate synthase large subunit, partial [Bacteroidales bacterium]|nr:carbamoyl phosphate synthase large subunit [Bacteroidales bacterium]